MSYEIKPAGYVAPITYARRAAQAVGFGFFYLMASVVLLCYGVLSKDAWPMLLPGAIGLAMGCANLSEAVMDFYKAITHE